MMQRVQNTVEGDLTMALNDDLLPKFDNRINGRDKQLIDCPINDPDAILQIMFFGRHIIASTERSLDDLVSAT